MITDESCKNQTMNGKKSGWFDEGEIQWKVYNEQIMDVNEKSRPEHFMQGTCNLKSFINLENMHFDSLLRINHAI